MSLTATIHTENAGGEIAITVFGSYQPAERDTDTPEGVEFEGAEIEGFPVHLSKVETERAIEALWEAHRDEVEKVKAEREDALAARWEESR